MEDYDADREVWLGPGVDHSPVLGVRLARYYGHSDVVARYKRDYAVDVRKLCSALLAVRARGALGAGQNLFCQTFKASCFGFGGSSTAFTVIASIA
jgi:hypothetical protein